MTDRLSAKVVRCSSLPLAFRCPGSVRPASIRINSHHEAADAGTAAHEVLRPLPTTNRIDWDAVPEIAQRHGANLDDTRLLAALGARLWNEVKDSFRGALTEVQVRMELFPGVELVGHADLLVITQTAIRVGDWKTGRKDTDYSHQFKGYAVCALLSGEGIEEATGTGLWVRENEIENYTMTRADVIRWKERLLEQVIDWDGVFHPGSHCLYCPRSHECEAANALIRRDVAAIADRSLLAKVECDLAQMSDAEKVEVFRKAELVGKFADRVRAAVRDYVDKNGDVVADGVRLKIQEENRREIDPLLAWKVLEEHGFGDQEFAQAMTLGVSKVEKIVAAKAGRGNGATAVRKLGEALSKANAVGIRTVKKLVEKRS